MRAHAVSTFLFFAIARITATITVDGYTTTMPGFILEERTTTSNRVVYDAPKLATDFPNLDLYNADGYAGVDIINISLLLSGTDGAGTRRHFAREEIQMPEQDPRPRRRSVRK